MILRVIRALLVLPVLWMAGCGYTTKSNLPEDIRTIHIAPVENAIDLSSESGPQDRYAVYRPGVELDLTAAIINRFVFDGTLKPVAPENADAVLKTRLLEYRRDPLRYSNEDEVEEYRVSMVIDVVCERSSNGQKIWGQVLSGDTTFFLAGNRSVSEDDAQSRAVEDLARRVVEKTVELW